MTLTKFEKQTLTKLLELAYHDTTLSVKEFYDWKSHDSAAVTRILNKLK